MVVVSLWRLEWETETPAIIFLLRPGWMDGWKDRFYPDGVTVRFLCVFVLFPNQSRTDRSDGKWPAGSSVRRSIILATTVSLIFLTIFSPRPTFGAHFAGRQEVRGCN